MSPREFDRGYKQKRHGLLEGVMHTKRSSGLPMRQLRTEERYGILAPKTRLYEIPMHDRHEITAEMLGVLSREVPTWRVRSA